MMKSRLAFFFLALFLPVSVFGAEMVADRELMAAAASADHKRMDEILSTHAFGEDVLGKALLVSVLGVVRGEDKRIEAAEVLLAKGAWINYSDDTGFTVLMAACSKGYARLAAYLLDSGANPLPRDARGRTALDYFLAGRAGGGEFCSILASSMEDFRAAGAWPVVMNVKVEVKKGKVALSYDMLADERSCVRLAASCDGGRTYSVEMRTVTGDVGCGVAPGMGRLVVWDALGDYPEGFGGKEISLDVLASAR